MASVAQRGKEEHMRKMELLCRKSGAHGLRITFLLKKVTKAIVRQQNIDEPIGQPTRRSQT